MNRSGRLTCASTCLRIEVLLEYSIVKFYWRCITTEIGGAGLSHAMVMAEVKAPWVVLRLHLPIHLGPTYPHLASNFWRSPIQLRMKTSRKQQRAKTTHQTWWGSSRRNSSNEHFYNHFGTWNVPFWRHSVCLLHARSFWFCSVIVCET
jgi:hypothetical protein